MKCPILLPLSYYLHCYLSEVIVTAHQAPFGCCPYTQPSAALQLGPGQTLHSPGLSTLPGTTSASLAARLDMLFPGSEASPLPSSFPLSLDPAGFCLPPLSSERLSKKGHSVSLCPAIHCFPCSLPSSWLATVSPDSIHFLAPVCCSWRQSCRKASDSEFWQGAGAGGVSHSEIIPSILLSW